MLSFFVGLAAVAYIGKLAVQGLGTARVLAILDRLFWLLTAAWCSLVWHFTAWPPPDGWTFFLLLTAPLVVRGVVVFIATGRS